MLVYQQLAINTLINTNCESALLIFHYYIKGDFPTVIRSLMKVSLRQHRGAFKSITKLTDPIYTTFPSLINSRNIAASKRFRSSEQDCSAKISTEQK